MNNLRIFILPTVLLVFATCTRFVSMVGFAFAEYSNYFALYFATSPRIFVFSVQFIGVAYLVHKLFSLKLPAIKFITIGALLLMLVSVVRFYVPIFLVSVFGDLLVIWWFRTATKNASNEYP